MWIIMEFEIFKKEMEEKIQTIRNLNLSEIKNEENTKNKLILPFLQSMGYSNEDIDAECDDGKHRKKIDYILKKEGRDIIMVECKSHGALAKKSKSDGAWKQLGEYYKQFYERYTRKDLDTIRFAILTDGNIYKFYTNSENKGDKSELDEVPFLDLNISEHIDEDKMMLLYKLSKSEFESEGVYEGAIKLKYTTQILNYLIEQFKSPQPDVSEKYLKEVCNVSKRYADQYAECVINAFEKCKEHYIKEGISKSEQERAAAEKRYEEKEKSEIENCEALNRDEQNALEIIKWILGECPQFDPEKIVYNFFKGQHKSQQYCAIFYDNRNKTICRFYFRGVRGQKKMTIPSSNGSKQYPIENVLDITKYANEIKDRFVGDRRIH